LVQTGVKYTALDKNKAIPVYMKSSYSMPNRTEIIVFENRIGAFSFIKTTRFLTCAIDWKTKLRINTEDYCEKHFWAIESFLIKINWGFLLKNNSWPTLCYWSSSTLCKGPFCAPIRKYFLNCQHPISSGQIKLF